MRRSFGPIGTMQIWAGTSANIPSGWLACDGSSVLTVDYPDLAVVMGAVGSSFLLPDLMTRLPVQGTPGELLSDQLKYSKAVSISTTSALSETDSSFSVSTSSSSAGGHRHQHEVNGAVFLESPSGSSNGFVHYSGGGVSHNSGNGTPGSNFLGADGHAHKHYIRQQSQGSDNHNHSVTLSGSADHSHPATYSSESVLLNVTSGTVTMPPRQLVIHIIRAL